MKHLYLVFFVILHHFAICEEPITPSTLNVSASSSISTSVDAVSGSITLTECDHIIPGKQPIPIRRIYIGGSDKACWHLFADHYLVYKKRDKKWIARVVTPSGYRKEYSSHKNEKTPLTPRKLKTKDPSTNYSGGLLNGKDNIQNSYIEAENDFLILKQYFGDGAIRTYSRFAYSKTRKKGNYRLDEEQLPNGNHLVYAYDNSHRLIRIESKNPSKTVVYASATITYEEDKTHVETSDGQTLTYTYNGIHLLSVHSTLRPPITYVYGGQLNERLFLTAIDYSDERGLHLAYYFPSKKDRMKSSRMLKQYRVKSLTTPEQQLIQAYNYKVHPRTNNNFSGFMERTDTHHHLTRVHFSKHLRERLIENFVKNTRGENALFRSETLEWSEDGKGKLLTSRIIKNHKDELVFAEGYTYDQRANIIETKTYGAITGDTHKAEITSTKCHYSEDRFNPDIS